jgi:S1-C subfamily serine protease
MQTSSIRTMRSIRLLLAICFFAVSSWAVAADKGTFGFSISVDVEGFSFNPVLKTVEIDEVKAGSPAELAGLVKGDQFIEIEGHVVAGAKAFDLKPYLSRNAGETVNFKVRKASGEIVAVALTAVKKL